jgi:CRISPR-associated protein Cas5h
MHLVRFRYSGRVGHFLRAEMNASALSYPVPPRTALLGLLGNILGLAKDQAPRFLDGAAIAVAGAIPRRHYHRANVRKHFPAALPAVIRPARTDETPAEEVGGGSTTRVVQEWLIRPEFTVYVGAERPDAWLADLEAHLREGRTHFTPCLGPAWMIAQVEFGAAGEAEPLPFGVHNICTVCARSAGILELPRLIDRRGVAVQELRMPRTVTPDRVFQHENYYVEMQGRPIPVRTPEAWSFHGEAVVFL